MHPSAANGILKILEEPAPHTFFILVTNAADKLLPTIISRTQIVSVPLLQDDELETFLVSRGIEETRAAKITSLADGNLNYALKLSEGEDDDNSQRFIEWMRACFRKSYIALVPMAEEYHALDRLQQKNLLTYSINVMRETLLRISGATDRTRSRGEELKFIQDFSNVMTLEKIEKSFTLMNDASYHLERNGSAKMIFLDLSIKLARTINP
jgi:DNA polymerase-3 subunit delta'